MSLHIKESRIILVSKAWTRFSGRVYKAESSLLSTHQMVCLSHTSILSGEVNTMSHTLGGPLLDLPRVTRLLDEPSVGPAELCDVSNG